ncbi:hypothetical protein FE784_21555 [Paenibacillus hemerocallicola]|uniref:Rhamnogalacturonase A/B/Epimerase-like pectate lyase domain-containing protein n=1 Tax=Paenibacillus hemerocallicola TaxID=1172614 RepID=A0A5C4T5V2_9BACL|nr:glycosyl hydrolase family 28-related protein [Paenibacillus hemerocallicola]TNJ64206.1 hypothetical protein FE784_21555 [Paenibacillus hemerocallicola]
MEHSNSWRDYAVVSDSATMWNEYAAAPQTHTHIPDCSFAGYRYSEQALPDIPEVISVKDTGAAGDGQRDDTLAFKRAIERAALSGGGAIYVPEGEYLLSDILYFRHSGIVMRGAGKDKTKLLFAKSLTDILGPLPFGVHPLRSQYAWCGGLIWVGPQASMTKDNWEGWDDKETLASLTAPAKQGAMTVQVDAEDAGKLTPSMAVQMTWDNPSDHSLLEAIAGHERMKATDWVSDGQMLTRWPRWYWPTEIAKVEGTTVTLKQPLRLEVREKWNVALRPLGSHIREVGIEHLTIRMLHNDSDYVHLQDKGFNGIYFNRAMHCWVREVAIHNAENGIIHAAVKSSTVSGLTVSGREHHHALALRLHSHDNVFTDFRIESKTVHGINTEGLSSGNVWRKGVMVHGTFDSHRLMSFDSIRTDITLHNDGKPGGGDGFGPFLGRRMVHWNVCLIGSSGDWVYQPDCMPNGALVGVRGAEPSAKLCGRGTVPGFKGCVVADLATTPELEDLFEAQLRHRLGMRAIRRLAR